MIIEHREPSDHYEGLIMDIPITNSPIHGGWSFHKPYTMQLDHGTKWHPSHFWKIHEMGIFFTIAALIKIPTGIRFLVIFRNPSEKWWSESQLGWWHSQLNGKNNVPNHQQVMDFLMVAHTHTQTTNTHFCWTTPTFLLDNLPFTGWTHTHTLFEG